jgi:RHS repeat-associated protein
VTVTKYVYDGDTVLQETDGSGTTLAEYTSTAQGYGDLLSAYDGSAAKYYEPDALGSTDALADQSQTVVDRWRYRAFGSATQTVGTDSTPFTWVGRRGYYADPETGLCQLGNGTRYYDPVTAQFLSKDPIGFAGGDSNLYRYVRNCPNNLLDPSGFGCEITKRAIEIAWDWLKNCTAAKAIVEKYKQKWDKPPVAKCSEKKLGKSDSNGWVDLTDGTIYLHESLQDVQGALATILFEMLNAIKVDEFKRIDKACREGKLSRNMYIVSTEALELVNARIHHEVAAECLREKAENWDRLCDPFSELSKLNLWQLLEHVKMAEKGKTSHYESYGLYWDTNCKAKWEMNQRK